MLVCDKSNILCFHNENVLISFIYGFFHSKATSAGTRWWHQRDSCTPGTTSQPTSSLPPSLRKWWGPTCVKSYWVPKSKIWCVWFLISNVEWSSTHKNITFWKITFHTSIFHELQLLYYFLFIDLQFWNELIKIYCVLSCVISFMLWNTPDDKAYFFGPAKLCTYAWDYR